MVLVYYIIFCVFLMAVKRKHSTVSSLTYSFLVSACLRLHRSYRKNSFVPAGD
jgi:hypothetical protein